MNNDNNQWSTSPTCIWCRKIQWYNEQWQWQWWKPSYWPQRLEATETAAGFQAKFGHMSPDILVTEWLETSAISGQNFALTTMTKLPLYMLFNTTQLMDNLSHKLIRDDWMQCAVQFWTNILHHALWVLRHIKVNNYIGAIKLTWNTHFSSNDGVPYISVILSLYSSIL